MDLVLRLFQRPEFIVPILGIYADLTLSLLVWHFDTLVSFLVAFAFAYGAVSLCEKLFPPLTPQLGARPRVWRSLTRSFRTSSAIFWIPSPSCRPHGRCGRSRARGSREARSSCSGRREDSSACRKRRNACRSATARRFGKSRGAPWRMRASSGTSP